MDTLEDFVANILALKDNNVIFSRDGKTIISVINSNINYTDITNSTYKLFVNNSMSIKNSAVKDLNVVSEGLVTVRVNEGDQYGVISLLLKTPLGRFIIK